MFSYNSAALEMSLKIFFLSGANFSFQLFKGIKCSDFIFAVSLSFTWNFRYNPVLY